MGDTGGLDAEERAVEAVIRPDDNPRKVRFLNDQPLADDALDQLGLDAYAGALENLIGGEIAATPFTVAINAPWGAGKSTVAHLLERRLRRIRPATTIICWFNAWSHGPSPDISSALTAAVARAAHREMGWWRRRLHPLPLALRDPRLRKRRRLLIGSAILLAVSAIAIYLGHASAKKDASVPSTWGLVALLLAGAPLLKLLLDALLPFWSAVSFYVSDPAAAAATGALDQVKAVLEKVVHWATAPADLPTRRLLVIVDDLDRCSADVALDLCTTAAQLLSIQNVVVLLLGDLGLIETEAGRRYGAHRASTDKQMLIGRQYIEKIVQYQVDLPVPTDDMLAELIVPTSFLEPDEARRSLGTAWVRLSSRVTSALHKLGHRPRADRWLSLASACLLASACALWAVWLLGSDVRNITLISTALACAVFALALLLAIAVRDRGHREATRQQVDELIRKCIDGEGIRDTGQLTAEVWNRLSLDCHESAYGYGWNEESIRLRASDALTRLYLELILGDVRDRDEGLTSGATTRLVRCLPANPRRRKRVANQIVLGWFVADRRQLLSKTSPVTREHIAKWAVLTSLWPKEARDIAGDPGRFQLEEQKIRGESWTPDSSNEQNRGYRELLRSDPALGGVIVKLTTMTNGV